jgi:hypothetical protein
MAGIVPVDGNMLVVFRDNSSSLADDVMSILNDGFGEAPNALISVISINLNESSRFKDGEMIKGLPRVSLYRYGALYGDCISF